MKLPISWLKEFVDTDLSVEEICNALVNVGFEVEDVIRYGEGITNIVVGKIVAMERHPDADKLQICSIDVGHKITVITGAQNVKVGDYVPVALDGANLHGKEIKASSLRGIMSYGMLCSGGELGLSDAFIDGASVNGILILPELQVGKDIVSALNLDEVVLDVSITANRPDCHSILGLAREVATALKAKLTLPSFEFSIFSSDLPLPKTNVTSEDCSAYTKALISDIKIEKSPKWLQRRLFMCGINPINNVVDITNYVLLEIGQPLHAFDLSMLEGEINIRYANPNETITALNGEEYKLLPDMTVIADNSKPLAIAGVMGGKFSGISDDTKTVFLESARFARGSVRNTSLKLGLRSDSSAKFERGVDYFGVEYGRRRALALFEQLGAGKVAADAPLGEIPIRTISTTLDEINGILGIEIPKRNMIDILQSLGMTVTTDCRNLTVEIPLYREDIDNFTDLAEEVIRFYGYDKMNETFLPTSAVTIGGMTVKQKRIEAIKDVACALGAYEIMTYSFTDKNMFDRLNLTSNDVRRKAIEIINPISEDLGIMKTELVSGMLSTISTNLTRKNDNFKLFELAKIYIAKSLPLIELPDEKDVLCVGMTGDFYEIKSFFTVILDRFHIPYKVSRSAEPYLHPGISADLIVYGKPICSFGKLHPLVAKNFGIKKDVYVGSMQCCAILDMKDKVIRYEHLPKFPPVERDLAFVVGEDAAVGDIIAKIIECDELVGDVELFDIYRGEQIENGFKSVALKIRLVPKDKTLVDAEIAQIMSSIIAMVKRDFDAKVRE